jgi:hypothetical protein
MLRSRSPIGAIVVLAITLFLLVGEGGLLLLVGEGGLRARLFAVL